MIRHILCPIDFSEDARRVADTAAELASRFGAEITAAHVYSVALPVMGAVTRYAGPLALDATGRARFERELREFMVPARRLGLTVRTAVAEGDPGAQIVGLCESLEPDMIVMGTHGRDGLEHLLLGSVAEKVLHVVRCPVVTVATKTPPAPLRSGIRTIVCAESLVKGARTLEYALSFADRVGARLIVIHALEELPASAAEGVPPFEYGPRLMECAADRLRASIPAGSRTSGRVEVEVVAGPAHEQILRAARQRDADFIVMGMHARNPIDLMFFGSTAQTVVRQAECPVLTVHSGHDVRHGAPARAVAARI